MGKMKKQTIICFLGLFIILGFGSMSVDVTAASTKSKTVKTQKQLDKALKNSKLKTIIIKSNAKQTFSIKKKNYKSKSIVLNAKKSTLNNSGAFKSISITSAKKLVQKGSVKKVTAKAKGFDLCFNSGAHTDSLTVYGDNSSVEFNKNSDVDSANIKGADVSLEFNKNAEVDSVNVKGDDASLEFNKNADVDSVDVKGDNAEVHIDDGSNVDQISFSGENSRIRDEENTKIEAEKSIVAIIDGSDTSTNVDLNDDGIYSSVVNRTDDSIELEIKDEKTNLPAGEVYSMDNSNLSDSSPLSDDNPLKKFGGMVKCGNICLEIHGCGQFSYMSTDEKVHGWYHNLATGTDYECYFIVDDYKVIVSHIENINFEKNYYGDAEFTITDLYDDGISFVSGNNVYGDMGIEYSLIYSDSGYQLEPGQEQVNVDNPLRVFSGATSTDNGVWLEIHGTGIFANMSGGNKIHGWYHNQNTGTDYECRFIVDDNSITVKRIPNTGYEKGFIGETSFDIVSANNNSIVLRCTSDVYGDKGVEYTFSSFDDSVNDQGQVSGEVNPDNPFIIFGGMVESNKGLNLEIHGQGTFASLSSGDHIHGWYHNINTGTDYECWFDVDGSKVIANRTENTGFERNYIDNATFEIVAQDGTSVTLKSTNNVYGDEGTVYTFSTAKNNPKDPQGPAFGEVNPNNPFIIFSGMVENDNGLNLEIHGCGPLVSCSYGDHIHGWYHNKKTGTDYECWFDVEGSSVTATRTENKGNERNYLGNATFEIVAYDSTSVTLKSTNDIYGDLGTIYTFSN